MFQDEAIFGRIGKVYKCWTWSGFRPVTIQQRIREYRYLFGSVEPSTGDSFFMIYNGCDTAFMNNYLEELSKAFPDEYILLACDNAGWHKSKTLEVPYNIELIHIPAYTPEMNTIEQIWDEMREKNFANINFKTIAQVVDTMCHAVKNLLKDTISSITLRLWMFEQLNRD